MNPARFDLERWEKIVNGIRAPEGEVTIAIVGKYTVLLDAYKSLAEALTHGGIANNVRVKLKWIESELFESEDPVYQLEGADAVLVPGGFGERGAEGKIQAVQFARERKIPYFGICFGMQMAVIEAARNMAGIADANSTGIRPGKGTHRRVADRMDQGQRIADPLGRDGQRRHDAPRRLSRAAEDRQSGV